MTFRQQVERWLTATTLSSVKAGAVAVKAYATIAVGNNLGAPVSPLSWQHVGVIFLGTFLWHFNDCVASLPAPQTETSNTQHPTSNIQ